MDNCQNSLQKWGIVLEEPGGIIPCLISLATFFLQGLPAHCSVKCMLQGFLSWSRALWSWISSPLSQWSTQTGVPQVRYPWDWFFYRDLLWLRLKRSLPWTRFLRKSRCCQNSHLGLEINRLVYRKQLAWLATAPGLPFTWAQHTTHTKTGSSRMASSDFQSRSHWHYRDFSSLGPWAQQNPLPRALTPAFTPQPRGTAGHAGSARSDPKHRKVCIPRWFDPHRYLHRRACKENNCHSSPMEASLGTSTANHRLYLLDTFWPVLSFSMTPEWKKFTPDQRWRRLSLGLMHQCNKIEGRGQQGFLPLIRVKVSNKLNTKERHQINYT